MAVIDTRAPDRELKRGSAELLIYRLEERGWINGAWVQKAEERRRRFCKVTPEERRVLARQKMRGDAFVEAVRQVAGDEHA